VERPFWEGHRQRLSLSIDLQGFGLLTLKEWKEGKEMRGREGQSAIFDYRRGAEGGQCTKQGLGIRGQGSGMGEEAEKASVRAQISGNRISGKWRETL